MTDQKKNSQILELLLSMNETARLPATFRYDLRTLSEMEAADLSLPTDLTPEQSLHELREELASGAITADEYARKAERLHNSQQVQPLRSLASLEAKVPHTTDVPEPPIDGIDLTETAPGYMTPSHEEEYLLASDLAIAENGFNPQDGRPLRVSAQTPPSEKDLTIRNPSSVYNWLRKNQPQVFLQDKDTTQHTENLSEKSTAKSGNAGGRGKRQSAAHGTPGPKTDHEDDDASFIPETGKSRKSKGGDDDGAYRPKGGSSRTANKRKREDGDSTTKGSRKKNRPSAGVGA